MYASMKFQSRNRESYLFKCLPARLPPDGDVPCFNLVIENLIFSSHALLDTQPQRLKFQSRNRESYLFKTITCGQVSLPSVASSFNLVIENLIFSRSLEDWNIATIGTFQSRNRESYLFKFPFSDVFPYLSLFQSRNRESYLFKPL